MKEQIVKFFKETSWLIGKQAAAEEIESFVFEFMDWIRDNCYKNLHLWGIGDDDSGIYYGNKELYDYWFKNIKSHGGVRMLPVTSSQIKSVGYASNTLYIEFTKGTVYSYASVPESFFEALKKAESVGKYFASEVKGKFDFEKTDRIVTNGEL